MTQEVLAGFLHRFVIVYLDDIIVFSPDWPTHLNHLALTFERLQQHHLRCAPTKCRFGVQELEQLVHQEALRQADPPKTRKQLRQFLGLCNWIREYVPHFAHLHKTGDIGPT